MIYGVSRNGKKGIGYKGKVSQPKKVKDLDKNTLLFILTSLLGKHMI